MVWQTPSLQSLSLPWKSTLSIGEPTPSQVSLSLESLQIVNSNRDPEEVTWGILWSLWDVLGSLGDLLEISWVPLGFSREPLGGPHGASWESLGASWGPLRGLLGASWGSLGAVRDRTWSQFGCPRGPKMEPKSEPRRSEKRGRKVK